MMKNTPRVRRQIAPMASANRPDSSIPSGQTTNADWVPGRPRIGVAMALWWNRMPTRVAAHAHERGMAEADQAAVAEDQIERQRGEREDQDPGREARVEAASRAAMACGNAIASARLDQGDDEAAHRARSALSAEQAARAQEQDGGHEQVDHHGADRAADAVGHGRVGRTGRTDRAGGSGPRCRRCRPGARRPGRP